jgi:Tetratricopeptide repeat
MIRQMRYLILLAAVLAGCATPPEQAPAPAPVEPPAPVPAPGEPPVALPPPAAPPFGPRENVAIAGLLDSARSDAAAGRLANAAASLERALRIEPRNPRLWQELARLRLKQGDFVQAESLAQRSNSWAGNDTMVRAENARIIEQARAGR